MEKLSVVIITYNEESAIERCIASVKNVADEVLVVDSYSTDKTKEICLRLGARFYEHTFEGYIQQKNYAISLASFDYILMLDADEALSETLSDSILRAKQVFDRDGYNMNRMTNYCGSWMKHGNFYPDRKLRLWDRRKGEWGGRNPHDHVNMQPNSKVGHLKGDILHYSIITLEGNITQFNKFTTIAAQELFSENRKISAIGVFVKGFAAFFKSFFMKRGFLDGYYGIALSVITSFATFMKYMKLRELNRNAKV
jgi:glycosyltransferase involved in cell wall biosynthesis